MEIKAADVAKLRKTPFFPWHRLIPRFRFPFLRSPAKKPLPGEQGHFFLPSKKQAPALPRRGLFC